MQPKYFLLPLMVVFGLQVFMPTGAWSQMETINYEEAKVPPYSLPDPLVMSDGSPVDTPAAWRKRRAEILDVFQTQVYGRPLPPPDNMKFEVIETDAMAVQGKAIRKRIRVDFFGQGSSGPQMTITLYLPRGATKPVPVFVGMHLFDSTEKVPVPGKLLDADVGEALPGRRLLEVILDRGYGIATLDAADFCPDDARRFRDGVLAFVYPAVKGAPGPEATGAIGTWAWALSRALDIFQHDKAIDSERVVVIGHSRMGKTAIWAGALDERFAIVISNNSGCGGAALSRRQYGETVARINRVFPHWFCGNFKKYDNREQDLSVDQHELVALIAPRPVYIASAEEDRWADPRGEFLAAVGADAVYHLLGKRGLETSDLPAVGKSVGDTIGYHLRVGKHALTDYDWLRYLDFADRHFNKRSGQQAK